jgi:hypothetical protein
MKDALPTSVLCWPKRLLSAEDLRRHLTSQRELVLLPKTIVTPLAADELRAKGVRIRCEESSAVEAKTAKWFYAQDKKATLLAAAIQALEREGISIEMRQGSIQTLAEGLVANSIGGVIITSDPSVVVCVANKIAGVRAVSVANVAHVTRAKKCVGANLFAIDGTGPTYFEMRQMLKTIVTGSASCPPEVAKTLQELDGHAHR